MLDLPTELWQNVFEQFCAHNVHIFRQSINGRLARTNELQELQLVCRKWNVGLIQLGIETDIAAYESPRNRT
jgi:hypothetical protein